MPAGFRHFVRPLEDLRSWAVGLGISTLTPWIGSGLMLVLGPLGHVPLIYTVLCAFAAFAALSIGLFFFHQLAFARSPEGKLIPVQPQVQALVKGDAADKKANKMRLALILANNSPFPIQYEVTRIQTSIDGRINQKPVYESKGGIIFPGVPQDYHDDAIDIEPNYTDAMEGVIKAEIRYGRVGRALTYPLKKGFRVVARFHTGADVDISWTHEDDFG